MNKAQLVTDFKNLIGPAGKGSEVSDTGIVVWLNDAKDVVVEIINETIPDYYTKKVTASSIEGEGEYSLPIDCETVTMVTASYDGTTTKRVRPLNNINQALDLQTDQSVSFTVDSPFYYITGDLIGFQPKFSSTLSDNIHLWYAYNAADMVEDTDEPDIPKKLHGRLKFWAYANYLDQNDEHVAAARMRQDFKDDIEKSVERMALRTVDENRSVEVSNDITGLYMSDWS